MQWIGWQKPFTILESQSHLFKFTSNNHRLSEARQDQEGMSPPTAGVLLGNLYKSQETDRAETSVVIEVIF